MKKHIWKIIFVGIAALLIGSVVISQKAAEQANEGVVIQDHVKGNAEASVTLTEYSDFQCPACAQFYTILKGVMEEHGDSIRFEYKHFPLISIHPNALPAARAAEAAGQQGAFFQMHDMLFDNQTTWSPIASPDVYFIKYAEELGLDVAEFKRHSDSSVINDAVMTNFKEAQGLNLRSTPTFFLNGEMMAFESYEDFIGQIEAALGVTSNTAESEQSNEVEPSPGTPDVTFGI